MTKAVRNKASKMTTEFGGEVAVQSAVRSSDSTTTMRVNEVIITMIDGATCNGTHINVCGQSLTRPITGDDPASIAVNPATGTAYVSDIEGVSVIPLMR